MNKVALIGAGGNMANRYQAIMDHCQIPYLAFDEHNWRDAWMFKDEIHSIIIASPTDAHYENIRYLAKLEKPILCEKPITKNPDELIKILGMDVVIKCVNQYQFLYDKESEGDTFYNYFKTGKDGLEWDCISIIALAKTMPYIMNTSPVWQCEINGKRISIADMDKAYVDMIRDWYRNPHGDKHYIAQSHNKVIEGYYVKG